MIVQNFKLEASEIKQAATGRWAEILSALLGIDPSVLDGKNHPCPFCRDGDNRFFARKDFYQTGSVHCRTCLEKENGDGLGVIKQKTGWEFPKVLEAVADCLGWESKPHKNYTESDWNDLFFNGWDVHKPGILKTIDRKGIEKAGGKQGIHSGRRSLIFPVLDADGQEVNQVAVSLMKKFKFKDGSEADKKVIGGRGNGFSGFIPEGRFSVLIKTEGYSDLMAMLTVADLPENVCVVSNAFGCNTLPKPKSIKSLAGRADEVWILHDCDAPGQKGAKKFSQAFAQYAPTKNLILPYPVEQTKGKDLRDWIGEGNGFEQLRKLADDTAEVVPVEPASKGRRSNHVDGDHESKPLVELEDRTDNSNATRFIDANFEKLRYVVSWKKWLAWTGKKWCIVSGDDRAMKLARQHANSLWKLAVEIQSDKNVPHKEFVEVMSFVKQSNDARRIENFLKLAKHDGRVSIQHTELDSDPYLLNCLNGTLDLKSMSFREHQQEDSITQVANVKYEPAADCPLWLQTLDLIFASDPELIAYVQTILGYCLSGDTGQHILPIAYGNGANGKSTVWNVVIAILGDYGMLANDSLLLGMKENHPTDKAALYGKRFVPISEPERGSKLRESRVKELTGDTTITARRMKEDFWSFQRTHKFFLATNHLPKVDGTDEGIWRRIKIIPFAVDLRKVTAMIPNIVDRMISEESSGILNWLLAGWRRYLSQNEIVEPKSVQDATKNYQTDSDALGQFLHEWCLKEKGAEETAKNLFQCYQENFGGKWSQTAFGRAMAERFTKSKPTSGVYRHQVIYEGVRLLTEKEKKADSNECSNSSQEADTAKNSRNTEENAKCYQLLPVTGLAPIEGAYREVTEQLVTTGNKPDSSSDQMEF